MSTNTVTQAPAAARPRASEVMAAPKEPISTPQGFLETPAVRAVLPFVNGGLAGMVATSIVQPIDLIKVRLQMTPKPGMPKPTAVGLVKEALSSGNPGALYVGLSAGLLRQAIYTTARMGLFQTFMDKLKARSTATGQPLGFTERAGASLAAGGLASILGTPADLALIRMQSDGKKPLAEQKNYRSVFHALSHISKSEGIGGLWAGGVPTVARAMALNFGQLATFSEAKVQLKKTDLSPNMQTLCASAIGGFFASFCSLPFDFVKTRLQSQKRVRGVTPEYSGMVDCFVKVAKRDGILEFYRAFPAYYVRIAPHA